MTLAEHRLAAQLARVEAVGTSDDGRIRIRAVALRDFSVRVRPDLLSGPEGRCARDVAEAARALIADHRRQVERLSWETHYRHLLPDAVR